MGKSDSFAISNKFWRKENFMFLFYSFRECHCWKRTKIEIKLKIHTLGLPQQTTIIGTADHHDLSVVCQLSSNLQNRWSTKEWTSRDCGGGGGGQAHSLHPLGLGLVKFSESTGN